MSQLAYSVLHRLSTVLNVRIVRNEAGIDQVPNGILVGVHIITKIVELEG